jgi:hypothetical protein
VPEEGGGAMGGSLALGDAFVGMPLSIWISSTGLVPFVDVLEVELVSSGST